MRMLTLWQPWASLLFIPGLKDHETRGWKYPASMEGETIVIHAAASPVKLALVSFGLRGLCAAFLGPDWADQLPRGAALGTVRLSGLILTEGAQISDADWLCGDWSPGRYGWRRTEPKLFPAPVPYKGKQGWGHFAP